MNDIAHLSRRQILNLAVAAVVTAPLEALATPMNLSAAESPSTQASPSAGLVEPSFVIENDYPYFGPEPVAELAHADE